MSLFPTLRVPAEGAAITDLALNYAKRASALGQAAEWNELVTDDPVFGLASGFEVGVGPRADGRYPLVWVRAHSARTCVEAHPAGPGGPTHTLPHEGEPLGPWFGYSARSTARSHADHWNELLRDHPTYGPASGLVVSDGPESDGMIPLVWTRRT